MRTNVRYGNERISRVLTISEVAEQLRLSPGTVQKLLSEGRIRGVRTGPYSGKWRISQAAVDEFLNGSSDAELMNGN
ncbi:MAG: DNA-binding protein [Actinomycetota bacterium]|nr:MAG: DNA-binding protein [Actinomycetota bacterium]